MSRITNTDVRNRQLSATGFTLLDQLPIGIAVMQKNVLVYVNRMFASFYDMQPSEIMGQPWSFLVRSSRERAYIRSIITPAFEDKGVWSDVLDIVHPTRGPIQILSSVERFDDSILISLADVDSMHVDMAATRSQSISFRDTLLGTKDGYWRWNMQTDEMTISGEFLRRLGYSDATWPTKLTDVQSFFHPDDRNTTSEYTPDYRDGNLQVWRQEVRIRRADGAYVWILGRGQIVEWDAQGRPLMMMGTYVDINDIKLKEEQHLRRNHILETITQVQSGFLETLSTEAMHEQILRALLYVTDSKVGVICELRRNDDGSYDNKVRASVSERATCRTFPVKVGTWQRTEEQLLRDLTSNTSVMYRDGDTYDELRQLLGCAMEGCAVMMAPVWSSKVLVGMAAMCIEDERTLNADDTFISSLLSTYGSLIMTDRSMSKQRVMQHELWLRTNDLERANLELEHANRMKDIFLANMSHELRSPLATILGSTEALLAGVYGALSDVQRRTIEGAQEGGHHLLTLINDILDLSKIRMGELELEMEDFDMESLIQSTISLVRELALKKGIRISYTLPTERVIVQGDPRRMKQAMMNLLTNAIKFTEPGGSVIVDVQPDRTEGTVDIRITDSGIGIPSDKLPFIFEAFYQLDSELSRKHEGTGLGLPIVQRIVDLHGGIVKVESTVGKGSTFTIVLPWSPNGEEHVHSVPQERTNRDVTRIEGTEGQNQLVYVVDDNILNAGLIRDILDNAGFLVRVFHRAQPCIDALEEEQPQLIVMDIHMPEMDGLEAIRVIRDEEIGLDRHVPIVALTALAMPGDREQCLAAGADEYVSKPLRIPNFLALINTLVHQEHP